MQFRILQQWQRVADHYVTDMTENPTIHSRRNAFRAFNRGRCCIFTVETSNRYVVTCILEISYVRESQPAFQLSRLFVLHCRTTGVIAKIYVIGA